MNEEERNTANICQEVNSKGVLQKQFSEEVLKPTRRSTRIRKPKESAQPSKKDVTQPSEAVLNVKLPKEKLTELTTPISCTHISKNDIYNDSNIPKASKDVETSGTLFQIENGEDDIAAMFDDIFEQKYTQNVQSLLPRKLNDSLKERKIFKRNAVETQKLNFSSYACNRGNLPAEDVSKVFKIISKPNPLSDIIPELKPSTKPLLKTYSNKRKSFQKTDVIESFGLPDHPIVPENTQPLIDDELDTAIQDVNEITILDMEYINDPWIITTEGEDLFPIVEEIRRKSEPTHEPFKKNGSFLDISDNFEIIMEPAIISSTPFRSKICEDDMSVYIATNTDTDPSNNEISIGAMKMNFKKISTRTDTSVAREKVKSKKSSKSLPLKKNSVVSKTGKAPFTNNDILFVEDDSLTVYDEEFEFSGSLTVPKSNRVDVPKKSKKALKSNCAFNKKGCKITRKRLRSIMHSDEEMEQSKESKNAMTTSSENQNSTADVKESVGDLQPKNILETDSTDLKLKCNSQFNNVRRRKSTHKVISSIKKLNQNIKNSKRVLRSSLQNRISKNADEKNCIPQNNVCENRTHKDRKDKDHTKQVRGSESHNKRYGDSESKEHNLLETQTLNRKVKPSNSVTSQLESRKNKNIPARKLSKTKGATIKRVLRSNQDCSELDKSSTTASSTTTTVNKQRSKPHTSNLMNTVQKCNSKCDVDTLIKDKTSNTSAIVGEIPQKRKGFSKSLIDLKDKKSFSEIKIVLEPIDVSKIKEKLLPDTKKALCGKSSIKKKLRSIKTTTKMNLDNDNQGNLVTKHGTIKNEKNVICKSTDSTLIRIKKTVEKSKAKLGISESSATFVEEKTSSKIVGKIVNETEPQKEVKSNKSDVKPKGNKSTSKNVESIEKSKTELGITESPGILVEEKTSSKIVEKIVNDIEPQKEVVEVKLNKSDVKPKGNKSTSKNVESIEKSKTQLGITVVRSQLGITESPATLVEEKTSFKIVEKIVSETEPQKEVVEVKSNKSDVKPKGKSTSKNVESVEKSKAQLGITERLATLVEEKTSSKIVEKIINETEPQKEVVEVKSNKSDVKPKGNKSTSKNVESVEKSKAELGITENAAILVEEKTSSKIVEKIVNETEPQKEVVEVKSNKSDVKLEGNKSTSKNVESVEKSKAELEITDNPATLVEEKTSSKIVEKIVNETDPQKEVVEVKSNKSNVNPKENKSTSKNTDVLHETETENLVGNDSITNSNSDTLEKSKKPLLHCLEISTATQDPTESTNLATDTLTDSTTETALPLILERGLSPHIDKDDNLIEQCNSLKNKKVVDETNSLEVKASSTPLGHFKDKSELCDLAENSELVPEAGIDKVLSKKTDEKDENPISKCRDLKEQEDLEIGINELQKLCDQTQDKENLKTVDVPLEDNQQRLLDSENKIKVPDSDNSKVEESNFSNLLKKEEDKTIISASLIGKIEPSKCLDNQNKLLSVANTGASKNMPVEEFKDLDPSPDSKIILDVISDRTKEDLVIDFRIFTDNSFDEVINDHDSTIPEDNTEILDTGLQQNEKENREPVISENQDQNAESHEKTSSERVSSILTTGNASNEGISNSISPDGENSVPNTESTNIPNSGSEIENNSCSESNKNITAEKYSESNAKPPEKIFSLLLSCEESAEKPENISVDSTHTITKEESVAKDNMIDMNSTHPLTNVRKCGRPKKSHIKRFSSGDKPRRESVDDMALLTGHKAHPNIQQFQSKRKSRKDLLDDMDLPNRYNKYAHINQLRPRGRRRRKSLDNTDPLNRSKENADVQQVRPRDRSRRKSLDSVDLVNECKEHAKRQHPRPRGRPRKKFLDNMDVLNECKEHAERQHPRRRGRPRRKSLDNVDLLNECKEQAELQHPRPRGRPRKKFLDNIDLSNESKNHVEHQQPRSRRKSLDHTDLPNECKQHAGWEHPRARGRPRRKSLDSIDLSNGYEEYAEQQHPRLRGRPRRKSVDDMDLLNRYKEYTEKKKRSKSVARSILEIRRKPNVRGRWRSSDEWISSHTRNKDCPDDNMDLLSRYEKYKDQMQNKNADLTTSGKQSNNQDDNPNKPKANVKKSIVVKRDTYVDTKSIKGEDFKVGDITWAQIGSHPYWPCLITKEPGTKYYKKIFQNKRYKRELYHVRFFGDKGRRAWIRKHQLLQYINQDDLKVLRDKMKSEHKLTPSIYSVKLTILPKWQRAVNEAEQLKLKDVKERLLFFTQMFLRNKLRKQEESTSKDVLQTSPISAKRKSNEHIKTEDESLSPQNKGNNSEIIQIEKKPKRNDSSKFEPPTTTSLAVEDVTVNQVENFEIVQEPENILSKMPLKRQIDEISEIDSKTSSDNITDIDVSLSSMEAQKALYKRNNLFKGISRDKVCQYCCKPGEVLKCKGRCNGSYHISCSLKILLEKPARGRRKKNKSDSSLADNKKFHKVKSNSSENSNSTENSHKVENCKRAVPEEQVQIITVPSSVYNTPPRKVFPPDFKNMTLAEQIDYKMKEIMRKFESNKTEYTGTCPEPPVFEESSELQVLSQAVRICSVATSSISVKKEINVSGISENSTDRADKQIHKKLKALANRKLFIRHVTADSENAKSDTSFEESFDNLEVDPKNFKCGFCLSDLYPYCFVCHRAVSKKGSSIRQRCSIYQCGRFYHPECLKVWPQTQWSLIQTTRHKDTDEDMDSFVCPLHVCHTCVSDDPRAATSRCSGDKIVKCLRCPSTYHSSNLCVPAGTAILSSSQIICPRHREKSKLYTINTTWCFLCSEGGNLICCETCPTSVHPECLPVNLTDDDKFICEDCESGRLPLYDEIVWVKLGKFRWWPALILFPNEVPVNIRNMKHNIGEFVVKFFGTYDYYWVNRGRSFLFQEGDTGQCNSVKKKVDAAFNRAVEEAVVAHKLKKEFKLSLEVEPVTSLKPPPYIRIKVNRPVGNVRHMDLDLSSTNACECDPNKPHPCGPDSDCLNRLLLTECNPEVCPAGTRCKNQSFEKREYPPLVPYKTQGRGWGLKTLAPIKKGQFVIEYVGELIDIEEYQRRIQKMHVQKEENYYFLTIDKDRIIDAGPKGNAARFMNHCCQPNCETQKWTVNGDTRVGLFATEDIPADTELTFNYNLECVGKEKKICRCGAPNCSGFIGVKAKQDTETKRQKKYIKKKVSAEPIILPPCFICGQEGIVISCNNKVCNKTYHQTCLKSTADQAEGKFICPWHNCNVCSKRTIRCCVKCINSYCPSHSDGNIRYDNLLGFICTTHDSATATDDVQPVKFKRKRSESLTEESAVTSTTSDDTDDSEDGLSLLERLSRLERFNSKPSVSTDVESDNESIVNRPSTSLENQFVFDTDYESQDESAVSSATVPEAGEGVVVKRKRGRGRGRPKKRDQLIKKIRLSQERDLGITASHSTVEDKSRNDSSSELTCRDNNLENR